MSQDENIEEVENSLDDCIESFAALADTEAEKHGIDPVYIALSELLMIVEQKIIYQNGTSRENVEKMKTIAKTRYLIDINHCSEVDKWR